MASKPTDDTVLRGDPVERTVLRLGRYNLKQRLGVGGMAEVYLAEQDGPAQFKKTVVIKRILPSLAQDPAFVEMFVREAQVAARLHHTNIVQIFELGEEKLADGTREYFIAMEYIDGLTLQRLAGASWETGRAVPADVAIRAIADAARGLHAAHTLVDEQGKPLHLVHRDISPDNLMVAKDGVTRVLDFGIAKGDGAGPKTRTGNLRGKIPFMAPEQIEGANLDGRCDQFALGVSLYWLLCGERPFDRGTDFHTMHATLKDAPKPPRELNPGIPPALERVILRLLEKDRSKRYASAAEVADELEELASPGTGAGRKAMLQFIERFAPSAVGTGNPLSETGDKTSNTRPLAASRSGDAIEIHVTAPLGSVASSSPRAITYPQDAAADATQDAAQATGQATAAPPPQVTAVAVEPPTSVAELPPVLTETAEAPGAGPVAAPAVAGPAPEAPALPTPPRTAQGNHPVVDMLAPPPRQGGGLGIVLAFAGVVVLFGSLALGALWMLKPEPNVDAGANVVDAGATFVDAGAAVAVVDAGAGPLVDAGAPTHALADAGMVAPPKVDAGGLVATAHDAGPAPAAPDAGSSAPPPALRTRIATQLPTRLEFRTEGGAVLGRGGDTLVVSPETRRLVVVDKSRGVSLTVTVPGDTLDWSSLPSGTISVKPVEGLTVRLGSERLDGPAPVRALAGTYQLRITGKKPPVSRPLTVKAGERVVIDPAKE